MRQSPSARPAGRRSVGHPVDVATGRLHHDFEDLVLPGRMPLVFARRYSSTLENTAGIFGPGWSSPFEAVLSAGLDGDVLLDEDGETRVNFTGFHQELKEGDVLREPGSFCELRREGDLAIVRRWDPDAPDDIVELVFASSRASDRWPLVARQDLEGQGLDILRGERGEIVEIRQRREHRSVRLACDAAGRVRNVYVRSLADESGRAVERDALAYDYDEAGRLRSMTDALGQRCQYDYDDSGRMARELNLGGMEYVFRYDSRGRCVESTGENGFGRVELEYDEVARRTRVSNALDQVTTYDWNEQGQVFREISPLGHEKHTTFDDEGRIVAEISPMGYATKYAYDERGDRVDVVAPTGAVTKYAYNASHQVTAITDPAGFVWRRHYDSAGRVTAVENPLGEKLTYTYGGAGDLVAITDPKGARRTFEWDWPGNLASATDWRGNRTRYEYDVDGQLVAVSDPLGYRTAARLDALGRVREVRLPDNAVRKFAWDAYDQPTTYVDELGAVTRWRYEACGLLAEVARPDQGRLRFEWSAVPGQLVAVINERGERYELSYDADGRLERERDFSGRITRYENDADGRVAAVESGMLRSDIKRDAGGSVLTVRHRDGSTISYEYDPRGLLLTAETRDCRMERAYDAVGRLVRDKQGDHTIESFYDAAGNRVRRVSSLGQETHFDWDENGQVSAIRWNRAESGGTPEVRFEYDARQDEIARQLGTGVRIEQSYDARGRRIAQRATRKGTPSAGAPTVERRYGYDAASNLTRIADSFWGTSDLVYDPVGRIISAQLPGHIAEKLAYDATDNLTRLDRTHYSGPRQGATEDVRVEYGPGNVLKRRGDEVCRYDEQGQLVNRRHADGRETRYHWNHLGQLSGVTLPDGAEWRYRYDAFSRRIRKEGPAETVEFVWDGDVVLHESHRYREGPGAVTAAGAADWEFDPDGFAPIAKIEAGQVYIATNDPAGNPRELLSSIGDLVWQGRYTAWGDVTTGATAVECPVRLQGQWNDEESGLYYNRFRYFDPTTGWYISPDPLQLLAGANTFAFAPNTTGWVDAYGLVRECPVQGFTARQFHRFARSMRQLLRRFGLEGHLVVQGSRARGTAHARSDIDVALRVDPRTFFDLAQKALARAPMGSNLRKKMLRRIRKGQLSSFDIGQGFEPARHAAVDPHSPVPVDFSVIKEGGPFDQGPFVDL